MVGMYIVRANSQFTSSLLQDIFDEYIKNMSNKEGYVVSIGPSRTALRLLGIWPEPNEKKKLLARNFFLLPSICILHFCIIPQTTMVVKVWGDLNAVLDVLTTSDIANSIALFKLLGVWYNREVLGQLVLSMEEDWNTPKTSLELHTMWKRAKLSRIMSLVIIFLAESTVGAYIFMSLFLSYNETTQQSLENYNESMRYRSMYFKSVFFYDVQPSPVFEITWLFQCVSSLLSASAFSSIDAFFSVLVLHLCGQLNILKQKLKLVPDEVTTQSEPFIEIIFKIVLRHEFLYKFSDAIERSFNLMFLVQIMTSSMALCLQGYQLIMITTGGGGISILELLFMLYFTLCFMFSLFVYCYVAEVLRTESMKVGDAAYESNWYCLRPDEIKLLILVMARAKRPLEITTGKFAAFSLQLYCSILKSSGGYISMLLAMKSRITTND